VHIIVDLTVKIKVMP